MANSAINGLAITRRRCDNRSIHLLQPTKGLHTVYLHHRIQCAPRAWKAVADGIIAESAQRFAAQGISLYGIWRSQIGRPRDELTAITVWRDAPDEPTAASLFGNIADIARHAAVPLTPTLRPTAPEPPRRQGNYAFRWFKTPAQHWPEFLDLCSAAWPEFEAVYDSQIIGLWRASPDDDSTIHSLLVTRRPDLAMWERSKLPANEAEAETRRKLSRRYDLCDDTVVYTSTLLTAEDREDTARWT